MEQEFNLLYNIPGLTDAHLETRPAKERLELLRLLVAKRKEENERAKAASKGK